MKRSEIAVNKYKSGYNCAQSVIFSFADKLNITVDDALKMATGFGGGIGLTRSVCGIVTAGSMVISSIYGRADNQEKQKQTDVYEKIREFIEKFEAKNGSTICKTLIMNSANTQNRNSNKPFNQKEKCAEYIAFAVDTLEEIINRNQ